MENALLLTGLLLTLVLAQLSHGLLPASLRPHQRPYRAWLLQQLGLACLYGLLLLLTRRPLLAGLLVLLILLIVLVVNQAKFQALREPLLFSDLYLYLQVFRHPRLFLPFLNLPLVLGAGFTGLGLLYAALQLEPPYKYTDLTGFWLPAGLIAGGWLVWRLARDQPLTFDANTDVQRLGLYVSLLVYGIQSLLRANRWTLQTRLATNDPARFLRTTNVDRLPDIVVVQSESFFDARQLPAAIKAEVLAHFDRIRATSLLSGKLKTPAWGANTLRPEFSFLSGISNPALQHYRFNPYAFLPDQPLNSLVRLLGEQGYECIAVHPNHADFFQRNRVFPLLGFEQFIDIAGFADSQRHGPYISDAACADKILTLLQAPRPQQRPRFIFTITMENHGPLHLEPVDSNTGQYYQSPPTFRHHDLSVYLRHLSNADRMLQQLTRSLSQQHRDTLLCWYGDHVPSMPAVYQDLGHPDGETEFLLWHNHQNGGNPPAGQQGQPVSLEPHTLGQHLLQMVGDLATKPH